MRYGIRGNPYGRSLLLFREDMVSETAGPDVHFTGKLIPEDRKTKNFMNPVIERELRAMPAEP